MLQKQHIFSAIILVLALALAGVTWSLISGTMVEIGFSKKKTVTQKRLCRRLRKAALLAALLSEHIPAGGGSKALGRLGRGDLVVVYPAGYVGRSRPCNLWIPAARLFQYRNHYGGAGCAAVAGGYGPCV